MHTPPTPCRSPSNRSPQASRLVQGKWLLAGLTALLLAGCVVEAPRPHAPPPAVVYAPVAPPPPRVEVVPVAPRADVFWVGGHWAWMGQTHVWVDGHWETRREREHWVPHHWEQDREGRWHLTGGYWRHD